MSKNLDFLIAKISDCENGLAVVDFGRGQSIKVAKRFLPKDCKEGDSVQVELVSQGQAQKRKKNLAQAILDEILKA